MGGTRHTIYQGKLATHNSKTDQPKKPECRTYKQSRLTNLLGKAQDDSREKEPKGEITDAVQRL
jgi:hypothetical protein